VAGQRVSDAEVASLVGATSATVKRHLLELETRRVFSRTDTGVIYSRRMVRDEHIRKIRAAAGKNGGNPNLTGGCKDNPEDNPDGGDLVGNLHKQNGKQKPTPSSSSSSSSSPSGLTTPINHAGADPPPLDEHFPDPRHLRAYRHFRGIHRLPESFDADLAAMESGMHKRVRTPVPWSLLGEAMHEMAQTNAEYSVRYFAGFVRKLAGKPDPSQAFSERIGRKLTLGEENYLRSLKALGIAGAA
jgi:hypothetical protein